jgi:hypothetical protein
MLVSDHWEIRCSHTSARRRGAVAMHSGLTVMRLPQCRKGTHPLIRGASLLAQWLTIGNMHGAFIAWL